MTLLAVAHRAGNSVDRLREAERAGADVVELDVHRCAGRLEVRHLKSMGPLPWLWDRWELVPASAPRLLLPEVLDAARHGTTLMLDLKGVGSVGAATARELHARAPQSPVLVCSRWWPSVEPFTTVPWARPVLSARGRTELARLRRRVRGPRAPYGVSVHRSLLSRPVVAELRERVRLVMTWPVDDEAALAEVLAAGVDGIISNEPHVLRAVAAEQRRR